jgi:hypothetical protein
MTSLQQSERSEALTESELGTSASAAKATAVVQAKFTIAARFRRDPDKFRLDLLRECKRTKFAEASRYHKPVGGGVVGWSVRFVETAARLYRNLDMSSRVLSDDDEKLVIECSCTDLETNTSWSQEFTLSKSVERKRPKAGQEVLGERTNSYGDTVYRVRASDDELLTKTSSGVSKALRTLGLRVLPADVLDEAIDAVHHTLQQEQAQDPDGYRKRVVDAFARFGVQPSDIAAHLGHPLEQSTAAEMQELQALFQAVKAGELRWSDIVSPEGTACSDTKSSKVLEVLEARRSTSSGVQSEKQK